MTNQTTPSTPSPTLLVDGSSYLFRAFYAIKGLTDSAGNPTNAIRGVISMLRSLIKQYPDSQVVVIFDAKGKTFRNDIFPDYKANRPPMPDELRVQIEPIHAIIRAMGLPLLIIDGVEADDVMGTLATQATATGHPVLLSTSDKDMAQLVSEQVTLVNTMTNTFMDRDGVIEKFGVPPERIIDYLALMGDKADNIPGVEKCGPKTAAKWLGEYGSLEGVIANADKVGGKIGENLRSALAQLPVSYELATIKCDVALPQALSEITATEPNNEELLALFTQHEFKSWIKELSGEASASTPTASGVTVQASEVYIAEQRLDVQYETVLDTARFEWWLNRLKQFELFSFDTETTSLDYMQAEIVGVSFAVENAKAAYVPLAHDVTLDDALAEKQLDKAWVLAQLKPVLESDAHLKVGQNLKYDQHVLRNEGIELNGIAHDTMLASYCLNSTQTKHDMDSLAELHLGAHTTHFEDIAGKGAKQKTFNQIPIEQAAHYAAEDADITLRLHRALSAKLTSDAKLLSVYNELEMPLLNVINSIENNGVLVDADQLHVISEELADGMRVAEETAHELAGKAFNLGSPKQLQAILFEEQGLPVVKKTPKGQPSTSEEVLESLANDGHELPTQILQYRSLSKLKSTYTDKLPTLINVKTGRVHTSYHQAVTATGRLSSSDPNLQNIPIKNAYGRRIREAFIAPEGMRLIAADYSQIELRIMAHLSGDASLLNAFNEGRDIHQATASEVFGVGLDEVTSEQRRRAKAVNFGLIYGMSAFGLAKQLSVSRSEAQNYVDTYFERYPGVLDYMETTRARAKEQGYVETVFGRRLYLPEINAKNGARRAHAERTAINAPMQGTAADIIKRAMIDLDTTLTHTLPDVRMIMQVHDELVFEVPHAQLDEAKSLIQTKMVSATQLSVPLEVDIGMGQNWGEAH